MDPTPAPPRSRPTLLQRVLHEPAPHPRLERLEAYPWVIVATVCVGAFMGQLDTSIVSLVLPALEVHFDARLDRVQWVAIVYLLVLIGLLTPLGRVADALGRKALYTGGFAVFIAGSALCGFAPDLWTLVAARALQAFGAAMLQANSVALITAAVPHDKLGRAIGVQATAQALGLAIGPTVGGFLIAWLDWRWVFWVNVPFGIAGMILARYTLPRTAGPHRAQSFNRAGSLLMPIAIGALLLGLTDVSLAAYLVPVALLLFAGFVYTERRAGEPLLGPEVLRAPGIAAGISAALLSYTVLFGALFGVPILLERVFGESPDRAGLILTLVPAVLMVVAQVGGWLGDRFGARLPTVSGMAIAAAGLGLMAWAAGSSLTALAAALVLFGFGVGLFIPSNNASIMAAAPADRLGVEGGLLNMMRGLGASFGVALVSIAMAVHVGKPTHLGHPAQVLYGFRIALLALLAAAIVAGAFSLRRHAAGRDARAPDVGRV
ncbi:MAG: MFS transporter [Burkholderiales bacterium]|nr:MFS transporter [Burkholderiales bacterium]